MRRGLFEGDAVTRIPSTDHSLCRRLDGPEGVAIIQHNRRANALVKAYDTANHKLMFDILKKYGAPPKLVSAIERMYTDLKVVLKIGKEITKINQTVGVRQGDPMSPVLFLFIIASLPETLEQEWEKADIPKASFHHTPLHNLQKGQLTSHPGSKSKLRAGDIF